MSQTVRKPQRNVGIKKFFSNKVHTDAMKSEPYRAEKQANDEQKHRITAKEAIGCFGFGLLLCWIFLCYFSNAGTHIGPTVNSGGLRLVGLGVFFSTTILFLIGSDFFTMVDMRKFSIIPMVFGLAVPLLELLSFFGLTVPVPLALLAWGLSGLATASAFLIWAGYFCRLSKDVIVPSAIVSALVAGCWYLIALLLPENITVFGIYLSLLLSIVCVLIYSGESSSLAFISRKDSEDNFGPSISTSISMSVAGCAHGFLLYRILFTQPDEAIAIVGLAFFAYALIAWAVYKISGRYGLLLAPVFRFSFVPLVLGFILLPFIDSVLLAVCEILLLAVLFGHWMSLFVNVSFVVQKYEVQSFYLWVRGNIPIFIGIFMGWAMGFGAYEYLGAMEFVSFPALLLPSLVFVLLFAISVTITPYGIDHLTMQEDFDHVEEENEFKATRKAWSKACEIVASQSNLTPRETEIFYLLAKGRNCKVIQRELSVSSHTVKSHNYNIYRKIGIDSQQELIDAVESMRSKFKEID